MSEIAKCRCGAEPTVARGISARSYVQCDSLDCCTMGPFGATAAEAIAAWNSLMRPRPVAKWGPPAAVTHLYVGTVVLGYVLTNQSGDESAVCGITGELFRGYDARSWLVERVRAAGFEVREEVSDE